jgi:hypothetical protein
VLRAALCPRPALCHAGDFSRRKDNSSGGVEQALDRLRPLLGLPFCGHELGRPSQRQIRRRSDQKDDALARARVLDLKVEIASFAREMPSSIQQYQIVGLGSAQSSRHLEAIGCINADAVTPEDASARVAGGLMGIDEENFLVIENRGGTKWWWLVHTKRRKPKAQCGSLGGFSSRQEGKSREMEMLRWPVIGASELARNGLFGNVKLCLAMNAARNSTRPAARR